MSRRLGIIIIYCCVREVRVQEPNTGTNPGDVSKTENNDCVGFVVAGGGGCERVGMYLYIIILYTVTKNALCTAKMQPVKTDVQTNPMSISNIIIFALLL